MDGTLVIALVVVGMPLAVIWALSKSASLRGPMHRPESRRPVQSLVTEAIPEERPSPDQDEGEPAPQFSTDSPPAAPSSGESTRTSG